MNCGACITCAHWVPVVVSDHDRPGREYDLEDRVTAEWGSCSLIGPDQDGYEGSAARANPTVVAYTSDGSDYWSALHTRPAFGCNQHQQMPLTVIGSPTPTQEET